MRLAVLRFSSMGDVILTVPAVRNILENYTDVEVVYVSRELFRPFFNGIERLNFQSADLKNQHKGFWGLRRLAKELRKLQVEAVVDLHNVLRSRVLCFFLRLPVYRINKGRYEKRLLTRKNRKIKKPLKTSVERYGEVFARAGYPPVDLQAENFLLTQESPPGKNIRIGIAPFSAHEMKMLPEPALKELLVILSNDANKQIFLLGSAAEKEILNGYPRQKNIVNMAGTLSLKEEISFIAGLDAVITMDSANLHMAAGAGTKTLSIWGPTHRYAGFGPPPGPRHSTVEVEDLACRPCSVYGNKACYRKDFACMNRIKASQIVAALEKLLNQ